MQMSFARVARLTVALCATTTLLACNSTTMSQTTDPNTNANGGHPVGSTAVDDQINGRIADFDSMAGRLNNSGHPLDSDIPHAGSATYYGFGAIYIEDQPDDGYLIGEAEVRVDFGTYAYTGEVTNMAGTVNSQASVEWDGALELSGGVGVGHPAGLGGAVTGTLTAGSDHLVMYGPMSGTFIGSPVSGLTMNGSDGMTTILNDEHVTGSIAVIAEH